MSKTTLCLTCPPQIKGERAGCDLFGKLCGRLSPLWQALRLAGSSLMLPSMLSFCSIPLCAAPAWPRDCSEVLVGSPSGVYIIQPTGLHPIMVYCEMSGANGGWTVIQRNRQDTDITWAESWSTYKHGFGNVHAEFWLGTEYIHQITRQKIYQVRFIIWDAANNMKFADYNLFSLDDESQGYRLRLGAHSGTAEDAMDSDNPRKVHNNMKFSTKDRDQDTYRGNCASRYGGGWWYSACYSVQLNVKGSLTWGKLCKGTWSPLPSPLSRLSWFLLFPSTNQPPSHEQEQTVSEGCA
uniref:Fibrinogen C-terminal domain-containing protein n=1 Tax=Serinus canaria TaxID=9135 RepID=A0A8C9MN21_SERCA